MSRSDRLHIPRQEQKPSGRFVPRGAAAVPDEHDPEDMHFRISYRHYKDGLCEMDKLDSANSRKCLQTLRTVGKSTLRTLSENNIRTEVLSETGKYKRLYKDLPNGAKVREHNIGATERLFYYTEREIFHVVAITKKHF